MNLDAFSLYLVLVAAGFILIAAEIFIPGAILGILGVFSLIAAAILGFTVFGARNGFLSAGALLIAGTIFLYLWVKYCPTSFLGKWFTLQESGKEFKSFDDSLNILAGKTGVAHTDLRPSGIAVIDSNKIDVISEAGFITNGSPIKVIQVVGGRVVVRQID